MIKLARSALEGIAGILFVTALGCVTQVVVLILTKAMVVAARSIFDDVTELLGAMLGW